MLGRPALITEFVNGVTKRSHSDSNVTGFGTVVGKDLPSRLVVHFINHLSSIHAIDINDPILESFQIPNADPKQAARWQVNWWTKVWHGDSLRGIPILGLAESWLKQNLPDTAELVMEIRYICTLFNIIYIMRSFIFMYCRKVKRFML